MSAATAEALLDERLAERGLARDDVRPADADVIDAWPGLGPVMVLPYVMEDGREARRLLVLSKSKGEPGGGWRWEKGAAARGAVLPLVAIEEEGEELLLDGARQQRALEILRRATVVILPEGESCGLSAWRHLRRFGPDLAVLVLPGAGMVGALGNFIPNNALVIVAFDDDQAGDKGAAEVRRVLVDAGVEGGLIRRFRPEVPGVEQADLRDLVEHLERESEDVADDLRRLLLDADRAGDDGHHHLAEDEHHHEVGGAGREEPWPTPVPLAGGPRPAFPLLALPPIMRAQVEAVAESVQVPIDLAAGVALGVLSAAAGGLEVQVKPDWREPLALYVCVVAESGEGKGPVVRAMTAPLEAIERGLVEAAGEQVAIGQARFDTLEQKLKQARSAAAKVGSGAVEEATLDDLAAELSRARRPELPRLLVDDVTPEALVSLLAQHGRIAAISDEGGLIDTLAGRYSDGVVNLDGVLKAWSRLPIRVDRKGRGSERVESPTLTLCLAVQPIVVDRLQANPVLQGRGLPARFLWFWPQTRLGRRRDDTSPVPSEVSQAWDGLIRELFAKATELTQLTQPPSGPSSVSSVSSVSKETFMIGESAALVLRAFRRANEERLRPEDGDLYAANGWAGKLPGQVVRIAGLMHLAEHRTAGLSLPIGEQTMRAAVAIGLYLVDHALAAFGLDGPGGPLAPDAHRVLSWITAGERFEFSHRDAHRALTTKARPSSDDWRPVLELLERLGYLRCRSQEQSRSRAGRPSSSIYEVNPAVFSADGRDAGEPAS